MKPLTAATLPAVTPGRNFHVHTAPATPAPDLYPTGAYDWGFRNATQSAPFSETRDPTTTELSDIRAGAEYTRGYKAGRRYRATWAAGFRAGRQHAGLQIGRAEVPAEHQEHVEAYLIGHDNGKRNAAAEAGRR